MRERVGLWHGSVGLWCWIGRSPPDPVRRGGRPPAGGPLPLAVRGEAVHLLAVLRQQLRDGGGVAVQHRAALRLVPGREGRWGMDGACSEGGMQKKPRLSPPTQPQSATTTHWKGSHGLKNRVNKRVVKSGKSAVEWWGRNMHVPSCTCASRSMDGWPASIHGHTGRGSPPALPPRPPHAVAAPASLPPGPTPPLPGGPAASRAPTAGPPSYHTAHRSPCFRLSRRFSF